MTSQLSWLDFSESDQKRARELIQLFSQPESRDELGIGGIRDALSNLMFPGISVIQTRARYFLFIPWLFKLGAASGRRGSALITWVENAQRRHIEALRNGQDLDGLIGRIAGQNLSILPATIYWNALQQFGILRVSASQEAVATMGSDPHDRDTGITELAEADRNIWHSDLPDPPKGFAQAESLRFDLTAEEAQWLAERLQSCRGTALAHLAAHAKDLSPDSIGPWDEPLLTGNATPHGIPDIVKHAERFSLVMQGAALLYNLLLTQRCAELGLDRLASQKELFESHLDEWVEEVLLQREQLQHWNLKNFWDLVNIDSRAISLRTQHFVESWADFAIRGPIQNVRKDPRWGELITDREIQHKLRSKARLVNERLIRQWGGSSGAGRLVYRWDRVKVIMNDIAKGLENA